VPPGAVMIGARTEHLRIVRSAQAAHGQVTWIEHLGDRNHLHVRVGDTEVVTLADADAGLGVGDEVAIEMVRPLYFDGNGSRIMSS
jgi:multiple sugar transport system ATP-binding protein